MMGANSRRVKAAAAVIRRYAGLVEELGLVDREQPRLRPTPVREQPCEADPEREVQAGALAAGERLVGPVAAGGDDHDVERLAQLVAGLQLALRAQLDAVGGAELVQDPVRLDLDLRDRGVLDDQRRDAVAAERFGFGEPPTRVGHGLLVGRVNQGARGVRDVPLCRGELVGERVAQRGGRSQTGDPLGGGCEVFARACELAAACDDSVVAAVVGQ
jgi:hypothetical protein